MDISKLYARLGPFLSPLAVPYAKVMGLRRVLYMRGAFTQYEPSCVCIAVGNIAFGGTGKSPVVGWLLDKARSQGKKAAVISRGYGGKPGKEPLLVSPGTAPALSGDEALMLAQKHPEARVIVHPKRALAAALAEKQFSPDWLILDDGMQHLAVTRCINLVLLRPDDLRENWGRVIPSGPWREGESALAAASAFLVRCEPQDWENLLPDVQRRLASFGKPVFSFSLEPTGLRRLQSGENAPDMTTRAACDGKKACPYVLVSGIARNSDVRRDAEHFLGGPALRHYAFADHHTYTEDDLRAIAAAYPASIPVVCTAKDAVKLEPLAAALGPRALLVLESGVRFGKTLYWDGAFDAWLDTRLMQCCKGPEKGRGITSN